MKMSALVQLNDFAVYYNTRPYLQELSFSLAAGESLAVFGPTSAGKSSLLKGLAGLLPFSGSLKLMDQSWKHESAAIPDMKLVRSHLGFAFQQNALFEFWNVLDNLLYPQKFQSSSASPTQTNEYAHTLLEHMKLWEHRDKFPSQLSGGMKKRLAIARALMKQPKMLICDDPLAGLDPISAQTVLELLMNAIKHFHVTLIVSTHSTAVIQHNFSHVLVLKGGKRIFFGKASELNNNSSPESGRE